jgi:hypothetical protein
VIGLLIGAGVAVVIMLVWHAGSARPNPRPEDDEEMAGLITANWDRIKDHF